MPFTFNQTNTVKERWVYQVFSMRPDVDPSDWQANPGKRRWLATFSKEFDAKRYVFTLKLHGGVTVTIVPKQYTNP